MPRTCPLYYYLTCQASFRSSRTGVQVWDSLFWFNSFSLVWQTVDMLVYSVSVVYG